MQSSKSALCRNSSHFLSAIYSGIFSILVITSITSPAYAWRINGPNCPKVDIIKLNSTTSAINLDGYTLGHFSALEIDRQFKPISPANDDASSNPVLEPFPNCGHAIFDIEVSKIKKTITVGDAVVGRFEIFNPTKEVRDYLRDPVLGHIPNRIQLTVSQTGDVAGLVRSGPDKPIPDPAGGGGGADAPGPADTPTFPDFPPPVAE